MKTSITSMMMTVAFLLASAVADAGAPHGGGCTGYMAPQYHQNFTPRDFFPVSQFPVQNYRFPPGVTDCGWGGQGHFVPQNMEWLGPPIEIKININNIFGNGNSIYNAS